MNLLQELLKEANKNVSNQKTKRVQEQYKSNTIEDNEWDRRIAASNRANDMYTTVGELITGETDFHEPYNMIIRITGPNTHMQSQITKFINHETNRHQKIVNCVTTPLNDETSITKIYIQASPHSLWYQKLNREVK